MNTPAQQQRSDALRGKDKPQFNESWIHLTDETFQTIVDTCQFRKRMAAGSRAAVKVVFDFALATRFKEHRPRWNKRDGDMPTVEVVDLLTGEKEDFTDTFEGGQAMERWKVKQLFGIQATEARS